MKLVGRNYYDPTAKVELKQFKLELWPGYETSIRQHEDEVLLCCEVSHKILRTDTVLEQMQEVYKRDRANFRSSCEKVLLATAPEICTISLVDFLHLLQDRVCP